MNPGGQALCLREEVWMGYIIREIKETEYHLLEDFCTRQSMFRRG